MKLKIVADTHIPFLKGMLESYAEMLYIPGHEITKDIIKDADALLIRTRTTCDSGLLDNTGVKFIGTATIGYDHINTEYCDSRGIKWTNAPGCNSPSVNQYVASALVNLAAKYNFNLIDRSLGIVGVGHVGSLVVRTAELFGMHVYLCDPPRVEKEGICGYLNHDSILRECDIITYHVPLQKTGQHQTFHMINNDILHKLNSDTFIINTSRGDVADTSAILRSLKDGRLKGYVADVWENEPDIDRELLNISTIATPHIAGYSVDGKARGTEAVVKSLGSFFNLGSDIWKAPLLPEPEMPVIELLCDGINDEEIMAQAVNASYNILEDDRTLRDSPGSFEFFRSNYGVRREFSAYSLKLNGAAKSLERKCRKLGFKIVH